MASQDTTASSSRTSEMNVLQAIQESSPNPAAASTAKTPSTRKRQLYDAAAAAQQFTPPTAESTQGPVATPRTVVKRQLRSRSSRKKC